MSQLSVKITQKRSTKKQCISYLEQERNESERKASLCKAMGLPLAEYHSIQAIKFQLKIWKLTRPLAEYKELLRTHSKELLAPEEWQRFDDYFMQKYGI